MAQRFRMAFPNLGPAAKEESGGDNKARYLIVRCNRSRAEGDIRTEWHRAAKIPPGCFGRSDRSRLIPRDGIPEERGVKVRDAVQFGPGVGLGPGSGFWARSNLGPTGPLPPSGGTGQAFESGCVPVSGPKLDAAPERRKVARAASRADAATDPGPPIARPVGGP